MPRRALKDYATLRDAPPVAEMLDVDGRAPAAERHAAWLCDAPPPASAGACRHAYEERHDERHTTSCAPFVIDADTSFTMRSFPRLCHMPRFAPVFCGRSPAARRRLCVSFVGRWSVQPPSRLVTPKMLVLRHLFVVVTRRLFTPSFMMLFTMRRDAICCFFIYAEHESRCLLRRHTPLRRHGCCFEPVVLITPRDGELIRRGHADAPERACSAMMLRDAAMPARVVCRRAAVELPSHA